jgi:hypothetical protein
LSHQEDEGTMPADSREAIGSRALYAAFVSHVGLFVHRDEIAKSPFVSTLSCTLGHSQTSLAQSPSEDTHMGTKLYVSNLPLSATEEKLADRFRKFGNVLSVAFDGLVRASRRGAFVEMETSADAHRAITAMNLSDFDGCLVSVYPALRSAPRH